jgi:acetyl-CoA carboxylase carboxyltransferase component
VNTLRPVTAQTGGSPDDVIELRAHVAGACTAAVAAGTHVRAGAPVVVLESMKTEHPVEAPTAAVVEHVDVAIGDDVGAGVVVARLRPADAPEGDDAGVDGPVGTDRPDLAEVLRRRHLLTDEALPEAVARRMQRGRRTARANVEDLLDPGSFSEYGGLAVAAQRGRRSIDELIRRTQADGLLTGTGTIDGRPVAVIAYDATVLAGTQGYVNHRKTDRLLELVERHRLPVVLFGEGGGGRPGDVDAPNVSGLDVPTFARFARLSGVVRTLAIVAGYCFAGNAALVGCCDVIVATEDSNLGMAGPAMIEGGGLGKVEPTEIGPIDVQAANGSIDVRVADEAAAVRVARTLTGLAAGVGPAPDEIHDQAPLRDAVPLARKRLYDARGVLERLADPGTVVELRPDHAPGMITALARIGGRPVGVLANDPAHLGGAIDTDGARSATRLVQLCDRWGLPVVSLCDTPGFMVGPEAEATGQVRAFGDMFVAAAGARVPWVTVVLRKAYGLGAQAMAGGGLHEPVLAVSWPTGEFGGMGLEGAVRLGFARELAAIEDPDERAAREAELIERAYEHGGALNVATYIEIDDVIDPIDTRRRVLDALTAAG